MSSEPKITLNRKAPNCTIQGLTAGTPYYFYIKAVYDGLAIYILWFERPAHPGNQLQS